MINKLIWFFRDVEWKHVDVRNFFFAFGEPMIVEALVKYDRIGIFVEKSFKVVKLHFWDSPCSLAVTVTHRCPFGAHTVNLWQV